MGWALWTIDMTIWILKMIIKLIIFVIKLVINIILTIYILVTTKNEEKDGKIMKAIDGRIYYFTKEQIKTAEEKNIHLKKIEPEDLDDPDVVKNKSFYKSVGLLDEETINKYEELKKAKENKKKK